MSRSQRSYCITIFGKELVDMEDAYNLNRDRIKYLVIGREICPDTKKVHLQGYIELWKKSTIITVKKILNDDTLHAERRKGSPEEASNYCKKDGNFIEYGVISKGQGARNDLVNLKKKIANGMTDYELLEDDPIYIDKHYAFIRNVRSIIDEKKSRDKFVIKYKDMVLNDIQRKIMEILDNTQNDRKIIWIVDEKGNSGKSYLANYLLANFKAIIFTNSKSADIAFAYNMENIVIFDFARSLEEKINYKIIEDLKNGRLFSTKYTCKFKLFDSPKVIIMSNFIPDINKLSLDRWDVHRIADGRILRCSGLEDGARV